MSELKREREGKENGKGVRGEREKERETTSISFFSPVILKFELIIFYTRISLCVYVLTICKFGPLWIFWPILWTFHISSITLKYSSVTFSLQHDVSVIHSCLCRSSCVDHSFLLPYSVPWYESTIFYLFILLLTGIWVVFSVPPQNAAKNISVLVLRAYVQKFLRVKLLMYAYYLIDKANLFSDCTNLHTS